MRISPEELALFPTHLEDTATPLITAFTFPSEDDICELYDLSAWLFYDAKEDAQRRFVAEKISGKIVQILELPYDVVTTRASTRSTGEDARPIVIVNGDDVRRAASILRPTGDETHD